MLQRLLQRCSIVVLYINLRISGEFLEPNAVTEALDIAPDVFYQKGDWNGFQGAEVLFTEGCWLRCAEAENIKDLDSCLLSFLEPFMAKLETFQSLLDSYDVSLRLDVKPEAPQVNFHLAPSTLALLASLGISFDFMVYLVHPI